MLFGAERTPDFGVRFRTLVTQPPVYNRRSIIAVSINTINDETPLKQRPQTRSCINDDVIMCKHKQNYPTWIFNDTLPPAAHAAYYFVVNA